MKSDHTGISRREALGALGLLAISGPTVFSAEAASPAAKKKAGIALQLYTLRGPAKKDLPGTLNKAADMGWKYVQWSGMPSLPADKIRTALDKAGLKCIAAHTAVELFEQKFQEQVAFWKTVGATYVGPGGMMRDCTANLKAWLQGARRLDALGAKLREVGMRLTFHNHTHEFEKFPGDPRTKHQILMDATRPENVCAELDLAWAAAAGVDVAPYLRKLKDRCPTVHAKDILLKGKKHTLTALGQGSLNWNDIFAAGKYSGIQWYIYEQDNGQGPLWDYVRASYKFLSQQSL